MSTSLFDFSNCKAGDNVTIFCNGHFYPAVVFNSEQAEILACRVYGRERSFFFLRTAVHHANAALGVVLNRAFQDSGVFRTQCMEDVLTSIRSGNLPSETLEAVGMAIHGLVDSHLQMRQGGTAQTAVAV